jgi:phospholipid transport system substrate-binding protein
VKITVKNLIPIALVTVLFCAPPSVASEITDRVKVNIDEAMRVLNDPSFMGPENTEKRRVRLRDIINEIFDFEEMSKRSLARHWRKRTEEEKEKFVKLFINFMEMSYIDKIVRYSDAEVLYPEEKRNKNRAVVKTKVITRQETDIPINYRLLLNKDGEWVAYDVVIEGVSLVSNYRTQFNQIIQNSSYEELIKKLEKRIEEWKQGKLKASEKE